MFRFRVYFFVLCYYLLILSGCSPAYKQMQVAPGNVNELNRFKPAFSVALYNTRVDVSGNHLSGLLIIKKMPDSSTRMVFSTEMGLTIFDFEFAYNGNFKVYSIIKKMNRKSVIKTLRHDFELILMNRLGSQTVSIRTENGLKYFIFPQAKGYKYYITNLAVDELVNMGRASNKQIVVEAIMKNYIMGVPDTIGLSHKKFEFNIGLKRL